MKVILKKIINSIKMSPAPVQDGPGNMAESVQDAALFQGFQVLKVMAKGSFGKVYYVQKIGTTQFFAMKVVPKDKAMMKMNEEGILSKLDHNFVVRLRHSFQTEMDLFLVFDFAHGGCLHYHIKRQGFFKEEIAKFYAAELVAAVAYLHENGIMHRDIKPSNILLDSEGHIVLTDFGLALEFDKDKVCNPRRILSNKFCGSLDFIAPEVYLRQGYGRSADWWSVGVTLYKMLTGEFPFKGENPRELKSKILHGKLVLPENLSGEAHSLLKGLLTKGPGLRLGERGSKEIKKHEWFGCIDWKKLDARGIRPGIVPRITGTECTANFEEGTSDGQLNLSL